MRLEIVPGTGVSLYRQIVDQIRRAIEVGEMAAGEELPAIRVLAERIRVNPNTVARAYMELARDGLVTKRQGAGTFVAERVNPGPKAQRLRQMEVRVRELLNEAHELGFESDEIIRLIRKRGGKAASR